jgi:drug/metabolite transporter (DMT)-like permease
MIAEPRHLDRVAILIMIGLCLSWGFNQIAAKVALADIPPLTQAGLRSLGGSVVLGVFGFWREKDLFKADGTLAAGVFAGVLFAGEFVALYLGLQWTSASHAVLFLYSAPFFVALGLLILVPQERLNRIQWIGLTLAFAGVALALGVSGSASREVLIGDLLCLVGGALWAATTIAVKTTNLRYAPPVKTLLYQLAISTPLLLAGAWATGERWPAAISTLSAWSMTYQTFWVVSVTFLLWFWMVRTYRAGELSAFTFLTPIFGVIAGWLLLGDKLSTGFITAVVCVAAGIAMVNWPTKKA